MANSFITAAQSAYPAGLKLARNVQAGHSVVHKFGRNSAVGTTYVPICGGGRLRTPQVAAATALRVKAGNAADTALGAGARSITLQGIDQTGAVVTETLATAGASASAATSATFIRLLRVFVATSGTYATAVTGSHVGDITIENAAGTEDWAVIDATDTARSQSQIGFYTVPLGYRAFIYNICMTAESTRLINLNFFTRSGILETAAPYSARRLQAEFVGLTDDFSQRFDAPKGPYPELTDIGFMAVVSTGSADVSIDFEIVLVKK